MISYVILFFVNLYDNFQEIKKQSQENDFPINYIITKKSNHFENSWHGFKTLFKYNFIT